jgi:filamentous hemagglutinin family protein
MTRRSRTLLLTTTALALLSASHALANPVGAQVVGGVATVQGQGTAAVTVKEQTNSAIINWQQFNIGVGESTTFVQPSASSVILNRVTGNEGPSEILGTLTSNGKVFLVNPDGLLFGSGAVINTGSFLATTNDIANSDFMAGRYNFTIAGRPSASIVNEGSITARNGGFAALVAPGVRNDGIITATLGTIGLAAGNGFTLDFYGDKLITLGVSDSIASQVIDVATGQPLDSLVKNTGALKADGGRVELTAAAARQVVDSVINNTGLIEADTIGNRSGMIVLSAATASSKPAGAPPQVVKVSGTLSAVGKKKGTKGGTIVVTGESIQLASATLDASGVAGGGKVLVGGDTGGGNPSPTVAGISEAALEAFAVPTATNVSVDAGSTINVSAIESGNGGKAIVWSDSITIFRGSVSAAGGPQGGNGGFSEISGKQSVDFAGMTSNLGAPKGNAGTILYDPDNIVIDAAAASTIDGELNQGQIVLVTAAGDIEVASNILKTAGGDATLILAAADAVAPTGSTITFDPNVVIGSSAGKLNLGLCAFCSSLFFYEPYLVGFSTHYFSGSLSQYVSAAEAAGAITPSAANAFFGAHINYNNAKFYLNGGLFVASTSNGVAEANGGFMSYLSTQPIGTGAEAVEPYLQQLGYSQQVGVEELIGGSNYPVTGFAATFADPPPTGVVSYGPLTSGPLVADPFAIGQSSSFNWTVSTQMALSTEPVISNLPNTTSAAPAPAQSENTDPIAVEGDLPSKVNRKDGSTVWSTAGTPFATLNLTYGGQLIAPLVAKSAGPDAGQSDPAEVPIKDQCVALIYQYATALTLTGVSEGSLGEYASGVAQNFASLSGGKFTFGSPAIASAQPEKGSVISFTDPGNIGHVAVVQDAVPTSTGGVTLTLFDQNWPSDQWTQVTLTPTGNGSWSGSFVSHSKDGPVTFTVVGWANPVSSM